MNYTALGDITHVKRVKYIRKQPMVKYAQRISMISVISIGVAIISNTILGYEAWEAFLLALSLTAASGINSIKEYYMIQSYADKYSQKRGKVKN